ncbi:MAG: flagellar type III secretion system pore protein FliP [Defluviitaleaceae bacterium]|nr:flagellar type III secretion system pore protein FliP [Defluviitaleaceae bacterium]
MVAISRKLGTAIVVLFGMMYALEVDAWAIELTMTTLDNPDQVVPTLQVFLMLTLIGMAPFLLLMLTSFTRIIISLSFMRSALGTQQMPPNQVLVGMALFLTMFIMGPIFTQINETAVRPFGQGLIGQEEAIETAMEPLREFMWRQVEPGDIELFIRLSGETYETLEDVPDRVLIPAFILGEITKGFRIGFFIFMPFIVIDMIVASILMAMGMMMLPPAMISLPFKILLFVMVDGWALLLEGVVLTFR